MNYPLLSEYCSAVKKAADNFKQLQHLRPVLDAQGEPVMSSGNFAVVFKMHDAQAGKDVAVKCFLKEQEGRAASYCLISQELSFVSSSFLTPIRYLEKELFVASNSTDDEEFPVVLMDWIDGVTLDRYVVSHLQDAYALQNLAFQFSRLASWLMSQPFAHGDLKLDNILVRPDGSLVLVDYDGMYVPAMQGRQARELGSPDFRHPQRTADRFNEHIDDFALTVILLSLKTLSLRPSLWNDYAAADRLLFSAADYRDLSACALLKVLPELFTDAELFRLYGLFLLAYAGGELSAVSFRLMNLSFPEKPQVVEVVEKVELQVKQVDPQVEKAVSQFEEVIELSTKVTDEDKEHGFLDEFRVLYSKDGLRLLEGNSNLTEYTVREGTRVICDSAFWGCKSLTSLTLPSGLTTIGDSAFVYCKSLTSLALPSGLTTIGDFAFWFCSSLTILTLPTGLTTIGSNPFSCCDNLMLYNNSPHFKIIDGMLLGSEGTHLITYFGKGTEYIVPNFVKSIGSYAFGSCHFLTNLTLPSNLTTIGESAFYYCSSLISLTLPSGLTTIGSDPFRGCKNPMLFNKSPHFKIIDDMLLGSEDTHLIIYFGKETECIVPDSVKSIGNSAFKYCSSLISLTLPSGLTTIGDCAFEDCSSLTSLILPEGLTTIGEGAFKGCTSLTSLSFPSGLTTIGRSAFWGCRSLTSLTMPSGLTTIGNRAFMGCSFLTSLSLPSGLTTIGESAFSDCTSLTSLTLPSSLTTIDFFAFSNCSSLRSLFIPKGTKDYFKKILPSEYHSMLRILGV